MGWGLIAITVAALGALVLLYNRLVRLRQMATNGWSDIEVQLKRRADLIPALIDTVKAYAKHEKQLFADITERRATALNAGENPQARGIAEGALAAPVRKLVAIAESYPDLKANQNFLDLQRELAETEDKIEMSRRFYNGAVRSLNTAIQTFPSNLVARIFGFITKDYFEISDRDALRPDVDFS